jgi:hypothetical protein
MARVSKVNETEFLTKLNQTVRPWIDMKGGHLRLSEDTDDGRCLGTAQTSMGEISKKTAAEIIDSFSSKIGRAALDPLYQRAEKILQDSQRRFSAWASKLKKTR